MTLPVAPAVRRSAFAALPMPPEIVVHAQPDLGDLRLVEPDGREVPYVLDRAVARVATPWWTGFLTDTAREARSRSVWVVDLGAARAFDTLALDIPQRDFAKRIRVEVSDDRRAWRVVQEDAGIFDRPWSVRVHHAAIALPEPVTARYLRLTADDRRSPPVDLRGLVASASRRVPADEWRRPVVLRPISSRGGVSRYRLELPPGFPVETLELETDDPAFARRVVLSEVREANGQRTEVGLGDGVLYRLRLEDETLSGEARTLAVRRPQGGELILDVYDGDSPPLRGLRGVVSSVTMRLVFPSAGGTLTLYYGNEATRRPLYDLEALEGRLGLSPVLAPAVLGPESANPQFRRTPALPFVAPRGAPLDVARWPAMRRFAIVDREDLYALTLSADDLALARHDLGDVRIVDESARQVPYIAEPAAAEIRVALPMERTTRAARLDGGPVSRYRLTTLSRTAGRPAPLPLSAIELTFQEEFFTRPARLLGPASPGSRGGERVLFSGTLARAAGIDGQAAREPITLRIAGPPERELYLEISEGDNAPLTLLKADGVLRVPRVAFKAAPGHYRLLLGNDQATPPAYDIASLRQEILSYSAAVVPPGPTEANPAFHRQAADYVGSVPPSLWLWGTLLGAVAALLLLTVRILRAGPGGGSREG